jgi:hypothetical protein
VGRRKESWLVAGIGKLLDDAVEVGLEEVVLDDAVFLEFGFGKRLCDLGRNFSRMVEKVALVELEEGV